MNYFKKRRNQANLTKTFMAKELGLDYKYYDAIEKGVINMPIKLMDKFNEIINRGKANEITAVENNFEADKFWKEVSQKDENGYWILVKKMREFNINSYGELVSLLGYKSVGTIYNYLQGTNPVGYEFKNRLYNFFSDEKNIQIPHESKRKRTSTKKARNKPVNDVLDKFYEETDFNQVLKSNNITRKQLADAIFVNPSTISNMINKKIKPSYQILQDVKNYLESVINDNQAVVDNRQNVSDSKYISKQKILDDCELEITETRKKIEEYQFAISELNAKIELATKVYDLIKKM